MQISYIVIDYGESMSSWICDSQKSVKESIFPDDDNVDKQSWDEFLANVSELDTYEIIELIGGTATWVITVDSIN